LNNYSLYINSSIKMADNEDLVLDFLATNIKNKTNVILAGDSAMLHYIRQFIAKHTTDVKTLAYHINMELPRNIRLVSEEDSGYKCRERCKGPAVYFIVTYFEDKFPKGVIFDWSSAPLTFTEVDKKGPQRVLALFVDAIKDKKDVRLQDNDEMYDLIDKFVDDVFSDTKDEQTVVS